MDLESFCDFIYIYAGAGTGGTLIWSGTGWMSFGPITSLPGQPLTIRFFTDGSVTYSGF